MGAPLLCNASVPLFLRTCSKRAFLSLGSAGHGGPLSQDLQEELVRHLSRSGATVWDGEGAHLRAVSALLPPASPHLQPDWQASPYSERPPLGALPPLTSAPAGNAQCYTRVRLQAAGVTTPPVSLRRTGDSWALLFAEQKAPPAPTAKTAAARDYYAKKSYFLWVARQLPGFGAPSMSVMVAGKPGDGGSPTFEEHNITEAAASHHDAMWQRDFEDAFSGLLDSARQGEGAPPGVIGGHCTGCPHFGECKPEEARAIDEAAQAGGGGGFSVFALPRTPIAKKVALWESGVQLASAVEGSKLYESGTPRVDRTALREFIARLDSPTVYYVDFETVMFGVPQGALYGRVPGNEQVLTQYSLHADHRGFESLPCDVEAELLRHCETGRQEDLPAEMGHTEMLSTHPEQEDLREEMLRKLLSELNACGAGCDTPVVVWHAGFEKGVLAKLAAHFPEHAAGVENVLSRIVDLEDAIKQGLYQDRGFQGSSSIKKVLPVLCPRIGSAYASQAEGGGIAKGDEASQFIWNTSRSRLGDGEVSEGAASLLQYCRIDTAAMVAIASALARASRA